MDVISGVGTQISTPVATQTSGIESKRNALQSALLMKALEAQRQQAQQSANTFEGKGQVIDVRV
jgi:hypothetical protein